MWWPNQFPPCPGSGTPRSGSGNCTWVKARYMLHNSQTEIRFDNFFLYFYVLFSNNTFLRTSKRILPQASSVITIMLRLSRTTRASTTNAGLPGSVKASTAPGKMQITPATIQKRNLLSNLQFDPEFLHSNNTHRPDMLHDNVDRLSRPPAQQSVEDLKADPIGFPWMAHRTQYLQ